MRTRQPAGLALTGQEVASTNTTLNTLLGGKKKSWMTGNNSVVMVTPRVRVNQRSGSSVLPSPAPSDEPSPVTLEAQCTTTMNGLRLRIPAVQEPAGNPTQTQPTTTTSSRDQHNSSQRVTTAPPVLSLSDQTHELQQTQLKSRPNNIQILSNTPSLHSRIPLLEEHIRKHGGFEALSNAVERPRFLLLRDACVNEDYFFIALHQLFCLWTTDPSIVTKIDGFRNAETVSSAFKQLSKLIRGNDGLSTTHLKWCTEFPSPLNDLLARSDSYYRTITAVCSFLTRLASDKASMILQCQQRGYPPLVDEMVNRLGLLSPVLQGVLFTASRRTLGIRDDNTGAQMEELFLQDREQHRQLAARYNTAYPPSEREVIERNVWLAEQYLFLRNSPQRRKSQASNPQQALSDLSAVLSPTAGSFGFSQQSPTMPPLAHNDNIVPQSPGLTGRFQTLSHESYAPSSSISPTTFTPPTLRSNYPPSPTNIVNPHMSAPYEPLQQLEQQAPNPDPSWSHPRSNIVQTTRPTMPSSLLSARLDAARDRARNDFTQSQPRPQFTMPNPYPGAAQSHQPQPNPSYQQASNFTPEHDLQVQLRLQHQSQLRSGQQRHNSASNMDMSAYSSRATNSMPTVAPHLRGLNSVHQNTAPAAPLPSIPPGGSRRSNRATMQNSTGGSFKTLLIPPQGHRLDPHPPNPEETAVHQAYLQSPYLVAVDIPQELKQDDPARRYYQAVRDFAAGPKILSHEHPLSIFEFVVPDDIHARLARDKFLSGGSAASREVKRGSLQYRMRCVQLKPGEVENVADCAVADTVWPGTIFMEMNGVAIEVRRKLHYGKDLPVDITPFVLAEGAKIKNRVRVSVPRSRKEPKPLDYAFSVEIVEILQHQQIVDICLRGQRISAQESINNIKASLSGSLVDDDEILMVVGDLTINLADPFLARMFDVPIRGRSCLHRECFDLQTFLNTRNSKPKFPQQPSMVDVWKCPLCGKDARPYSLQVDEFLVAVRETLAARNLLDTKAIVISSDGSWMPKPEPASRKRSASKAGMDDYDAYESDNDEDNKPDVAPQVKSKQMEVIELDDD